MTTNPSKPTSYLEIFWIFLRLGSTSFGGPIAHLSYFHNEFVKRRNWVSEKAYAELVALCQFLPGPASSQVSMAIGFHKAGYLGAIAAWLGFTLPSATALIFLATGISFLSLSPPWVHALKIVTVAVVAHAVYSMSLKFCSEKYRIFIGLSSALILAYFPSTASQLLVILVSGVAGILLIKESTEALPHLPLRLPISKKSATIHLIVFVILLLGLPIVAKTSHLQTLSLMDSFYRVGSLVFGGGHVVLPMLQAEVVPHGWVPQELFLAGYGATQAMPGPLFSFAAYLGAVSQLPPSGWLGGMISLFFVFLPAYLLILGILPWWEVLRKYKPMRLAMQGVNAAVVGLLFAALYNPIGSTALLSIKDLLLAITGFSLLMFFKVPAWGLVMAASLVAPWIF